jgi:hypothetical protein
VATRRKIDGYRWRERYADAMRHLGGITRTVAVINRQPETAREHLVDLALLAAESRTAVIELAEIAEREVRALTKKLEKYEGNERPPAT